MVNHVQVQRNNGKGCIYFLDLGGTVVNPTCLLEETESSKHSDFSLTKLWLPPIA